MVENASLFLAYGELQNAIRYLTGEPTNVPLPLSQLAIAASGAGAITSFLLFVPLLAGTLEVNTRSIGRQLNW
jgi:hypothetical protein